MKDFADALAEARLHGSTSFTDPETGTEISIDPRTGIPGNYSMMVRHLRLEDQRRKNVWWRRAGRRVAEAWAAMVGGAT